MDENAARSAPGSTDAGFVDRIRRREWTGVVLTTPGRVPPVPAAGAIGVVLAAAWGISYATGGAGVVPPHWFYLPVFAAGVRFGLGGALATAVAATVVAGPLLPLRVDPYEAQPLTDWTTRGAFFIVIGLAVTVALRRLQLSLDAERGVLAEAQGLSESKALIIESVSHEFRTPLTVIKGIGEILAKVIEDPDAADLVESLQRSTVRLENLTETVLAAADALDNRSRGPGPAVDLTALCAELSEELAAGVEVRVSGPRFHVPLPGDLRLLRIALRGLLDNATRFAPEGTDVRVVVDIRSDEAEIRVSDWGVRIDPEALTGVFEPFGAAPSSAARGGSERVGLGVFAAKVIVERAGGRLSVETDQPGRNQFAVWVPVRS